MRVPARPFTGDQTLGEHSHLVGLAGDFNSNSLKCVVAEVEPVRLTAEAICIDQIRSGSDDSTEVTMAEIGSLISPKVDDRTRKAPLRESLTRRGSVISAERASSTLQLGLTVASTGGRRRVRNTIGLPQQDLADIVEEPSREGTGFG